jgi:release factor glutamine methyltransferase
MYRQYLREVKNLFKSKNYPQSEAEDLFINCLKVSYTDLFTKDIDITQSDISAISHMVERRLSGEPLAHILGNKEFFGRSFKVTKDTLIPRPETEILLSEVIKRFKSSKITSARILEIGTGSGCIIISLIRELKDAGYNVTGVAIDISEEALAVARENAKTIKVSDSIEFIKCRVEDFTDRNFNIVVSNPPYIATNDILSLEPSVRDYEPHIALDGGSDGLDFYREIAKIVSEMEKCIVGLEFGIGQSREILKIIDRQDNVTIVRDLGQIERVIIYEKNATV